MSNEDKILAKLDLIQNEMAEMRADIANVKHNNWEEDSVHWGNIDQQREAIRELSNLLTEEEGNALSAFIGE